LLKEDRKPIRMKDYNSVVFFLTFTRSLPKITTNSHCALFPGVEGEGAGSLPTESQPDMRRESGHGD
jgi:hypothetical protein